MVRRDVSGRYRARQHGFDVRLRVDVDGPRSVNRVSADYYRLASGEPVYAGSMRIDAPVVTVGVLHVTVTGTATFSLPTKCKRVKVTIPRVALSSAPAAAMLRHVAGAGVAGTAYECAFESTSFRTVELEEAHETGIRPIASYDTSLLPSPGTPRTLTVPGAFAEAGIEMESTGKPTSVDTSAAGHNATWSDAELHAAMEEHFSRWGDRPRWAVWLLHAASHDDERIAGLMFDQRGRQRQGCAVFYGRETDTDPEIERDQLHTCVHELGHTFNLPHSWQKSLTEPPIPSRPAACSWMNYPDRFPGGADAYWPEFGFGFDEPELIHLRHAFETNVIMGGNPFSGGAARERTPGWDTEDRQDPGLRLKLIAPQGLGQNVPVTVAMELSATAATGRLVPPILGPRPGNVDIAIRRPNGTEFLFEPLLHHCRGHQTVTLRAGDPAIRDHAFIHYGKGGFAFERPGRYLVRARFAPEDGPVVLSNVAAIDVRPAVSLVDRRVTELIGGDEQVGTLMSLLGSDARGLQRGNRRLNAIIGRYPTHPVASVARLVQAANLARGFKQLDADGTVQVRAPRIEEAADLVADVVQHERAQPPAGGEPQAPSGATVPTEQLRIKPGVDPSVVGFFNSRLRDVAAAVPSRAVAGAAASRAAAAPVKRSVGPKATVEPSPHTSSEPDPDDPKSSDPTPPSGA